MASFKSALRRLPFYRELRQGYIAQKTYHKLWPYLVNRLWAAPRLAGRGRPLDRPVDTDRYTIHLMAGHGDLLGMLWALGSWHAFSADSAHMYIHEDGTFTGRDRELLGRLFPHAQVIDYVQATAQAVSVWLANHPILRGQREVAKNIFAVKLLDPYFVSPAPGVLVIDSDLLWFATPHELHEHIRHYQMPVFWPSSGKPTRLGFKGGGELRPDLAALNTGLVYYEKRSLKLATLEEFFEQIDPDFRYVPLLDQPAYAYALGEYGPVAMLPSERYQIHGAAHPGTVAKHYTGPRREQFWFEGVERLKARLLG